MKDNLTISPLHNSYVEDYVKRVEMCLDPDEGFLHFAYLYAKITNPTTGLQHVRLYDFQCNYLRNMHKEKCSINMMARQMGKTTCAAIYIAWRALFFSNQNIAVASNRSVSSKELLNTIRTIIENCPKDLMPGIKVNNKTELTLDNGSRSLAKIARANDFKGMTLNFLYLDEFAFVDQKEASAFLYAVLPSIVSQGQLAISSTPNQTNDSFAKIWTEAQKQNASFKPFRAIWSEHPDRDSNWKNIQVSIMGQSAFNKEYECIV